MANAKTVAQRTSAADKSIGFDYQYYYFLNKLLNLKVGQSVGLEVKDDVHTQLDGDFNILYQLKHSLQTAASGAPIALAQLDIDLWKTLSNWSKIIADAAAGRSNRIEQLNFINRTEFHLVSNKSQSKKNQLLEMIERFKRNELDFKSVKDEIQRLKVLASDKSIIAYIRNVQKLAPEVAELFFRKIFFELELDDIVNRVKQSILEKAIDSDRVDSTFARLDSNVREDNFIAVKAGSSIVISFEQFMKRYRKVFEDSRGKTLRYAKFKLDLPIDIFSQKFIKHLVEIEDISLTDQETAIEYTTHKVQLAHYLRQWVQTGELVADDVDALHHEVRARWRIEFRDAYRSCGPQALQAAAHRILGALRRERYKLSQTELNTPMSNGELYHLSDNGLIGWHRDWEKHEK
ncbi:hypothetical protein BH11PSE9_BH11PSE9_05050 [soil metagenome]